MMKKLFSIFKVCLGAGIVFIYSCTDEPAPSLYELPPGGKQTPAIVSIDPPNVALAGVTHITITGNNFSTIPEENFVTFNGVKAKVLSAANTQLVVVAAAVTEFKDSVDVKIAVLKSELFSNIVIYSLNPAVVEFYKFDPVKLEFPYAVTTDNLENVYTSLSSLGTKKIDNQGVLTNFAPKGPETFFRSFTLASDNSLYAVTGGVKGVYKVVPSTAPAAFVASSQGVTDNPNSIDFDQSKNVLWAGGSTGIIYRIKLDKNVKKFSLLGSISAIRVAGNFLFASARKDTQEVVWKIPILSADSLGTPELYFNFSEKIDAALKINTIEVSADGDLYIGSNKSTDPIYVVHPDKSFEILYPGLITTGVYSLAWGSGNFLYMSNIVANLNKTILKIDMQKLGAP
jgi:hypothetical protein